MLEFVYSGDAVAVPIVSSSTSKVPFTRTLKRITPVLKSKLFNDTTHVNEFHFDLLPKGQRVIAVRYPDGKVELTGVVGDGRSKNSRQVFKGVVHTKDEDEIRDEAIILADKFNDE